MGVSIWQVVVVVILFLLLFGRGKIPALMGDLAQGIKSFKTGLRDDPVDGDTDSLKASAPSTAPEQPAQTRSSS